MIHVDTCTVHQLGDYEHSILIATVDCLASSYSWLKYSYIWPDSTIGDVKMVKKAHEKKIWLQQCLD